MSYTTGERACHIFPPLKKSIEDILGRELTENERLHIAVGLSDGVQIMLDNERSYNRQVRVIEGRY